MRNQLRYLVNHIPTARMQMSVANGVHLTPIPKESSVTNTANNSSNGISTIEDFERSEAKLFDETFDVVSNKLTTKIDPDLGPVSDWLKKVLHHNVPHGKRNRGMALVLAYKVLLAKKSTTATKITDKSSLARVLGWCIEILQGFFLVHDDIMDQSVTRRGNPCWYKNDNVGLIAINDGIMLNNCIYALLREYLSQDSTYLHIIELFTKVTELTAQGQCLDVLQSSPSSGGPSTFNEKIYSTIVKYKTAYYSFSLPIRLALYLAGITDDQVHAQAENILLKIGHFFQVQDDYLDCYGDPEVIGKIGRDIEEGKCCWPFVTALAVSNDEQKKVLFENYGKEDEKCVKIVKKIYENINLEKIYNQYEEQSFQEIASLISAFEYKEQVPLAIFDWLLKKIYRRIK